MSVRFLQTPRGARGKFRYTSVQRERLDSVEEVSTDFQCQEMTNSPSGNAPNAQLESPAYDQSMNGTYLKAARKN